MAEELHGRMSGRVKIMEYSHKGVLSNAHRVRGAKRLPSNQGLKLTTALFVFLGFVVWQLSIIIELIFFAQWQLKP